MSKAITALLALILFLAACAPSAEEIASTAQALAETIVAEAQSAVPSATNTNTAEPTSTLTSTPTSTEVPRHSETASPSPTSTVSLPTAAITNTLNPMRSAPLRFLNNSGENLYVVLSGPVNGEYAFSDTWILTVAWGSYSYRVWIGGEGPYEGSFTINNLDKYTLVVEPNKVKVLGP